MLSEFRYRLRAIFRRKTVEAELNEELAQHLERQAAKHISAGMPPDEARRRARIELGGTEQIREECRDGWGSRAWERVIGDLGYSLRQLRRNPGFTVLAIVTLSLGIGANTAIFSLVNGVLLQPLNYRNPKQLFLIQEIVPRWHGALEANLPDFQIWQRRAKSFQGIAIAEQSDAILTGMGEPVEIHGVRCSASFFDVLGVRPALGRGFLPNEDASGHGQFVMLANGFWRSRFGGDPAIVGKTITLDGKPYEIAGVLPPGFRYLGAGHPAYFEPLNGPRSYERGLIGEFDFDAIGRLAPGATPRRALAELNLIQAQIAREAKAGVRLEAKITPLKDVIVGPARHGLIFLLLAVGAVLLIVCINLANLLLARAPGRMREAAIREALGASRARIAGQLLAESLLLALAGGVLGVGLAATALHALPHAAAAGIPRLNEVAMDGRVLIFTLGAVLAVAALFGALPAWKISRYHTRQALQSGSLTVSESRRTRRMRQGLVGGEVGLSTALLIVAALLAMSLVNLLRINPGFVPRHALAAEVDLPPQSYRQLSARLLFYHDVLHRLRALPGVKHAGFIHILPLTGSGSVSQVTAPGQPQSLARMPMANYRAVSRDYFAAMGIPVLRGRSFAATDRGRSVVLVSQNLARRFWPGENPIGKICINEWGPAQREEVVGVVGDVRNQLNRKPPMMVYVPDWGFDAISPAPARKIMQNFALLQAAIVVRTSAGVAGTMSAMRQAIHRAGPDVPIVSLRPMTTYIGKAVRTRRFGLWIVFCFGGFGVFLTALGIAGVVANAVAQRRHELGIRMALGAQAVQLRRLVVRQGMIPVLAGLAAGMGLAGLAGRLIQGVFFGVGADEPVALLAVAGIMLVVAYGACVLPARRGLEINPAAILRRE